MSEIYEGKISVPALSVTSRMEQYFQNFIDLLNSGDPTMRTWFLIRSNYLPIVLSGLYVLTSIYVGPFLMRNRKPFNPRISMIVFNFFLVAVYTACFVVFIWNLPYTTFQSFCGRNALKKGDVLYTYAQVSYVLYIMKYLEYLDTIFFIIRKKQSHISFLHVFHHAVVPIIGWLLFRTERAAFQLIFGELNGFVHIIMYSYYGLAAMGPSVRKYLWWKKYITQLQIIQFILILFLATVVAPLIGCKLSIVSFLFDIFFAPFFLFLFFKFYMQSYQLKKRQKEARINMEKADNDEKLHNSFSNEKMD